MIDKNQALALCKLIGLRVGISPEQDEVCGFGYVFVHYRGAPHVCIHHCHGGEKWIQLDTNLAGCKIIVLPLGSKTQLIKNNPVGRFFLFSLLG